MCVLHQCDNHNYALTSLLRACLNIKVRDGKPRLANEHGRKGGLEGKGLESQEEGTKEEKQPRRRDRKCSLKAEAADLEK